MRTRDLQVVDLYKPCNIFELFLTTSLLIFSRGDDYKYTTQGSTLLLSKDNGRVTKRLTVRSPSCNDLVRETTIILLPVGVEPPGVSVYLLSYCVVFNVGHIIRPIRSAPTPLFTYVLASPNYTVFENKCD